MQLLDIFFVVVIFAISKVKLLVSKQKYMFICNIYIFLDCNSFMVDLNFQDLKSAETHLRTKAYHTLNIYPLVCLKAIYLSSESTDF